MDFSSLIHFLFLVVILSIAFAIVKYLIMPVVPAGAQTAVWAILGLILLIALIYAVSNYGTLSGHPLVPH